MKKKKIIKNKKKIELNPFYVNVAVQIYRPTDIKIVHVINYLFIFRKNISCLYIQIKHIFKFIHIGIIPE